MEAETRMATARQLAYIEKLGADTGVTIEKPITELTMVEASELIAQLLQKANTGQNGSGAANGKSSIASTTRKTDFGSGARLGMGFKYVYRNWVTSGVNIFKNKKEFIKNVLRLYAPDKVFHIFSRFIRPMAFAAEHNSIPGPVNTLSKFREELWMLQ